MDFSTLYLVSCKEELISIMKLSQVIKWVSHQVSLNKKLEDISKNSKKTINKGSHQKKEPWKDGRHISYKRMQSKKLKRKQKKRKNKKQKRLKKLVLLLKRLRKLLLLETQNQPLLPLKLRKQKRSQNTPNQKLK